MDSLFDLILDKDEHIVQTFKPNKTKLYFKNIFCYTVILLFFMLSAFACMFIPDETGYALKPIFVLIPISIFVILEIVLLVFLNMYYKKTFYAYTNKRIIIRTGIIGVDFKSLDMNMIGAIDVYVSLLDKIIHKNTGTIRFGSMSSPISSQLPNNYSFEHLTMPYENYKLIKSYIDEYKESKSINK